MPHKCTAPVPTRYVYPARNGRWDAKIWDGQSESFKILGTYDSAEDAAEAAAGFVGVPTEELQKNLSPFVLLQRLKASKTLLKLLASFLCSYIFFYWAMLWIDM